MTITLNGTTGITTPAGTIQGDLTTTGNTVLGDASTDTLNVANGGLIKDSSGNLGLGVTPSAWKTTDSRALQLNNPNSTQTSNIHSINDSVGLSLNGFYSSTGWKYVTSSTASLYWQESGSHKWGIAGSGTAGNAISFTQAMTLDSSGNLLVAGTANPNSGKVAVNVANSGRFMSFINNSNSAEIGYIQNNSGTVVIYSTSSDYRLKENIAPMTGALEKVKALKPVTYTWKSTGNEGQGFIAHELQQVCPDAVCGTKDEVDAEGNPVYQGIDTSFLVATLTAAIQEQQAIITDLKARIETLENK